ncbi:MAG: hypothetical protein WB680_23200 [Candidatus Acidiferrales bacterium]
MAKTPASAVKPLKKTTPRTVRVTAKAAAAPTPDDFPLPEQPTQRKRITGLAKI